MSQANVEIVRRIYDGSGALTDHVDAEIEYVNPPEAVEPGTRRGFAEVAAALQSAAESFDSIRHEIRDLFDGGDVVVASVRFLARSRGSDAEVGQDEVHTWTFRDGKIVRFEWGRDLDAALAAAGLEDDGQRGA
jgi:ketosteroid isomerase-like protein